MMSFRLPITGKNRKAGRFIASVHRELQRALVEAKAATGITQQALSELLGVNRSVVNRRFLGKTNLTLRTIGEIAWALGYDPVLEFRRDRGKRTNLPPTTSTIEGPDELIFRKTLPKPVGTRSPAEV